MHAFDSGNDIFENSIIAGNFDAFLFDLFEFADFTDGRMRTSFWFEAASTTSREAAKTIVAKLSTTCLSYCVANFIGVVERHIYD